MPAPRGSPAAIPQSTAAATLSFLLELTMSSANLHSIAMSCTVFRKQHSGLGESPGDFRCSKHKVPKLNKRTVRGHHYPEEAGSLLISRLDEPETGPDSGVCV